jgi:hypothetical protein
MTRVRERRARLRAWKLFPTSLRTRSRGRLFFTGCRSIDEPKQLTDRPNARRPAVEPGNRRVELERVKQHLAMPSGGRPLVMAKRMPAFCNALTAFGARLVRTFSSTSVPSTSASTTCASLPLASPAALRRAAARRDHRASIVRPLPLGPSHPRYNLENPEAGDCSPTRRGWAAPPAIQLRYYRRAETMSRPRSCSRRAASRIRCWAPS